MLKGINDHPEINPADLLAMMAQKLSLIERLFREVHTIEMNSQTRILLLVLRNK